MAKKTRIIFTEGDKVFLRPLSAKDINEKYLAWINDAGVTRFTETGNFPTTMKGLRDFYRGIKSSKNDIMLAIISKKDSHHIGNIKLGSINWIHRYADLGIIIGEKKYWGKGYGTEACRLLLKYAFVKLNLNRVCLGVWGIHGPAIRAYKRAGFKIEGRRRNKFHLEGKYVDEVAMGILKKEFIKSATKGRKGS